MKLTHKQVLEVSAALNRLDTFKFSGKTRVNIAKRITRTKSAVEDIQASQKALFKQYGLTGVTKEVGGRQLPVDDPYKTRKHNLEWLETLNEQDDYELGKFLLADLDLQTNNLSITVLSQMIPIISDLPKAESRTVTLRKLELVPIAQALVQIDQQGKELKMPHLKKLALAQLLADLSEAAERMEEQRQQLVSINGLAQFKQNGEGLWESVDEPANIIKFNDAWTAEMATKVEVQVPKLSVADLDLDANNIPASVLSILLLIVEDAAE